MGIDLYHLRFLTHFFQVIYSEALPLRNEIVKLAQGSTRYNMSKIKLMKLTILLPCLEEQIFIAKLLYSIDIKIETEKKKFGRIPFSKTIFLTEPVDI